MRALLVHNPAAGTKGYDKDSIVDALRLADFKVEYVSTKEDKVKSALKEKYDLVVAAGGDGTVAYVFTHFRDRSIPIGLMPLGSANNISRSLGIAGTPRELAEQWRIGHIRPFYLMVAKGLGEEDRLCTEAFGVGVMAELIERRAKGKKADGADDIRRGRRTLSEILADAEPLDIEVNVDGKPWKSDILASKSSLFRSPARLCLLATMRTLATGSWTRLLSSVTRLNPLLNGSRRRTIAPRRLSPRRERRSRSGGAMWKAASTTSS